MRDNVIDISFEKHGFQASDDTTSAPIGALRVMRNAQITERGGISPRPGTLLLGTKSTAGPTTGFYNFRRSLDTDELLMRGYDAKLEYIAKSQASSGWSLLKTGFNTSGEFGFAHSLVNTLNEDYTVFSNRYEPYQRWTGAVLKLNGALSGGETSIVVDSTLLVDVYQAKTATSSSATTLTVSTATWAADMWINFYVLIKGGALTGQVRKITDSDGTSITFDTLGSDPGSVAFEIRKLAIPASGTVIYAGTTIAYTAVPTETTITVANAHAAADNVLLTLVPTEYEGAPRGNRIANYLARIVVGNVRNAMARGTGGALEGYSSAGSLFVSKLKDPFDFSLAATRNAGEGDLIAMPYGGGNITDVVEQEEVIYAMKERYIEAISYSQDANDLANREPLKSGVGSIGKTTRGADDVYFFTADKQLTTIGRVKQRDIRPQTMDIGFKIKRYLENADLSTVGRGIEIVENVYFPIKSSSDADYNDVVLVYNRNKNIFEGIWDIGAFGIERWNGNYYYASASSPNVYQMFTGYSDQEGDTKFSIDFEATTHYMNLTGSHANSQAINGISMEGYIAAGSTFNFEMFADFASSPFLTGTFAFTEEGLLDGTASEAFLGGSPLGIGGLGIGEPEEDGRRHFLWRQYFPFTYGNYFSFGLSANSVDNNFEVTRIGLMLKDAVTVDTRRIKALSV